MHGPLSSVPGSSQNLFYFICNLENTKLIPSISPPEEAILARFRYVVPIASFPVKRSLQLNIRYIQNIYLYIHPFSTAYQSTFFYNTLHIHSMHIKQCRSVMFCHNFYEGSVR